MKKEKQDYFTIGGILKASKAVLDIEWAIESVYDIKRKEQVSSSISRT